MQLRITAYAISRTFDMTSHPRQPQLATHCQLLLFRPVINTPRCLQDRIRAQKARILSIPVFLVQKSHGFAITVTYMLCTSHFYCCYLHIYMSSAYYLSICVLCAHYLQWSLIYSFLTDNVDVIHMSSLVLFIYPIMYNLVSTHCLHKCTLSMSFACCPHMYTSFACHLYHSSYTLLSRT